MSFEVLWRVDTLDALAELYVTADRYERDRMAAGVEALNQRLAVDPLSEGESRTGDVRVAFIPLLIVRFRVDKPARVVRVTGIVRYGR